MTKKLTNQAVCLWKPVGQTPLEALQKYRLRQLIGDDVKLTYAGRLDPLAEGVLVVLVGLERFKKESYLNLTKIYEIEVLFGISTDSGDILGLIKKTRSQIFTIDEIKLAVKFLIGEKMQLAPPYSSPSLDGKNFKKMIEIKSIKVGSSKTIVGDQLLQVITERINLVKGDFRQNTILTRWSKIISPKSEFQVVKLTIEASAGAYMRVLAEQLGERLKVPALAYNIVRTQVGSFSKLDCLDLN